MSQPPYEPSGQFPTAPLSPARVKKPLHKRPAVWAVAAAGVDLQTAQNTIQSNGVFMSRSHDLLGMRNQVLDSNWIVCTQNIPAGQQVTAEAEGLIGLGVVKREEPCP